VVGNPLTFENNEEGFNSFLEWISKWLSNQNIDVVTVNPYLVKEIKKIEIIPNPKAIRKTLS
jgi:transposase